MKNNSILIILFLCAALLVNVLSVTGQEPKTEKNTIESIVKDENGNPISGATIYGNGGSSVTNTDLSGKFSITVIDKSNLFIEADNYESALFTSEEYNNMKELILRTSPLYYGEKDLVNIAFGQKKRGDLINAVSYLNAKDLIEYNNQSISAAISGQIPGLYSSTNIRNYGSALIIVDGLQRDISTLRMSEVEQITILKDLNSAILYGSAAVNGVILITTKRGEAFKRKINVTGYYGVSKPRALPNYLGSADFMTMYNEARVNDGLSVMYGQAEIDKYKTGNNYRYPSVDWYSSDFLKSVKPYWSTVIELSGGNNNAQYYTNLAWDQDGTLFNFGEGANSKTNRFNVRGNVDLKINDWIKTAVDVVGIFNQANSPVSADFWSNASVMKPHLFSPLIPINLIDDPSGNLLTGVKNTIDDKYLLGGTSSYQTNPIASGYSGGINTNVQRTISLSNRIDFDLKSILNGLKFHTNLGFDFYSSFDQSVANTYAVYEPVWSTTDDKIINLKTYGIDTRPGVQNILNGYYSRRFGFNGILDYNRIFNEDHNIGGSLILFGNTYNFETNLQALKNVNLGLRIDYAYKNKYLVDFSSALANSVKLPMENRRGFSPSLGLAWIISSENFLSSVSAIDLLKFRASVSYVCSDNGITGYYFWEDVIYRSGTRYWFETSWSNVGTRARYGPNPNLDWEKRKEFNFGLDGVFFNNLLQADMNVFINRSYDLITRPSTIYPGFYADFLPYYNFNCNAYRGGEICLIFNKKSGNVSYNIGANFLYATTEVMKRDEIYTYDYQYRKGKPINAIFGLVDDGFYNDLSDISGAPLSAFGTVKPGDLKYIDQNNDKIVDSNDEVQIGCWDTPYSLGINMKVSYRNFTLFARVTGRFGGDGVLTNNYYWVDGSDKYSDFILNRWTESTKNTATFPRLSSVASPNNFRYSTFWLYSSNNLSFDAVQLTYELPKVVSRAVGMKNLEIFVNGYDLFMVAKNKKIMELAIGREPYYRSFSAGIKTMF